MAGVGGSELSQEALRELQEGLLRAVLLEGALPGKEQPLSFPDLGFLLRQAEIPLLDENLATGVTLPEAPRPLRVLSRGALAGRENVAYLHFRPAEVEGSQVALTLEARMTAPEPDQPTLGLSTVRVTFRPLDGAWEAVGDPVMSAA